MTSAEELSCLPKLEKICPKQCTLHVQCQINAFKLYTQEEWDKISEKINQLPTATDRNAAAFVRLFFGKATSAVIDKQGRVPIAKRLMEYANLKKDVVLVGANTRLEIWDSEEWDRYQDELSDDIMMDGILNYGLNI